MTRIRPARLWLPAIAMCLALAGCDLLSPPTVERQLERAKAHEDKGDLKAVIIELKQAAANHPQHAEVRLRLGQAYLKNRQWADAEKELTKAKELGASPEAVKPLLGEAWLMLRQYDKVLEQVQPSPITAPKDAAEIQRLRGDAQFGKGARALACDLYRQAHALDVANLKAHWGLAQCEVVEGRLEGARAWFDRALKLAPKDADTWLLVGDLERLRNRPAEALVAYDQAARAAPHSVTALVSRASMHLDMGKTDAAKRDVARARQLAPEDPDVRYLQASLDYREGRHKAALEETQKLLRGHASVEVLLLHGAASFALGQHEQAAKSLGRAVEAAPGSRKARLLYAMAQIRLGRPDQAQATLRALLRARPDDAAALAVMGQALLQSGKPAEAAELFARAAERMPQDAAVRTNLGLSHLAAGDTERGLAELGAAAAMEQQLGLADHLLLMQHIRHKRHDQALAVLDAMQKKAPDRAYLHNLRGAVHMGRGDYASARRSLEQCLRLDPTHFPAVANLAAIDLMENKPQAARGRYEALLARDKGNVRAMLALADLVSRAGAPQEALTWMERAAKADPRALEPRRAMVAYHLRQGEPLRALAQAREAAAAHPDAPGALELLGQAQLAAGEPASAVSTYKRLTELAPNQPLGHLRLAQALAALGSVPEARAAVLQALTYEPNDIDALSLLASLELAAGKPAAGLEVARRIARLYPQSVQGLVLEGDMLAAQRQHRAAARAYEQAMAKAPSGLLLTRLHQALEAAGEAQAARERLDAWLKANPQDTAVRQYRAQALVRRGERQAAVAEYEAVLRAEPDNAAALNDLAWLYQEAGDARALALAERAHQLAPRNAQVLDTLGWILLARGEHRRALALLREAAGLMPGAPGIRYHLAAALARSGDRAGARRELQALLARPEPFPERGAAEALLRQL